MPGPTHISNTKQMEKKEQPRKESIFKSLEKKVDQFMGEVNEAGERLSKEFEEKLEDLKGTAEKVRREAENKERWKEVESNLKKAAGDLNGAFKAAFRKRS